MTTEENCLKGKILIAKVRFNANGVKLSIDANLSERFTNESVSIPAGALFLCVAETKVKHSSERRVQFLYKEGAYEIGHHLGILDGYLEVAAPSEKLLGKSFCFTGELTHPREYFKALVELHGGTAKSSVTKGLSYLVMRDTKSAWSTKAAKAQRFNTTCIDEPTLMAMVQA